MEDKGVFPEGFIGGHSMDYINKTDDLLRSEALSREKRAIENPLPSLAEVSFYAYPIHELRSVTTVEIVNPSITEATDERRVMGFRLIGDLIEFVFAPQREVGVHRSHDSGHARSRRGERALSRKYSVPGNVAIYTGTVNYGKERPYINKSNNQRRQLYGATSRSHMRK